jgi:hypothetical protein
MSLNPGFEKNCLRKSRQKRLLLPLDNHLHRFSFAYWAKTVYFLTPNVPLPLARSVLQVLEKGKKKVAGDNKGYIMI